MVHTGKKVTDFRSRFSDLCRESGQSMSELAKNLHISRQTISAWQTGERSPKEPTILSVARYFGVDEMWLMGFDVEKSIYKVDTSHLDDGEKAALEKEKERILGNPDIILLLNGFSRMPPEQIRKAKDVMKAVFTDYFKEEKHDDA